MTHEKLVAGTSSPTRYTKIIRNPGAGTKYNRTYQETDYVSRYTKTVAGGKDYVPPAPPGPEYEEPLVKTKAMWHIDNKYEVGQEVTAIAATWREGNPDTQTYRSRWQTRPTSSDAWTNKSWINDPTNQQVSLSMTPTEPGQLRFQSQVRDTSWDPVLQVNSFASIETVTEAPEPEPDPLTTEIGEVTAIVNDIPHFNDEAGALTVLMNDPITAVISITGDASPSYTWEARNDYPIMVGSQTASTVLTFPEAGLATVTCTIVDNTATDTPKAHIINFYIVDAKTFEELKTKGEI